MMMMMSVQENSSVAQTTVRGQSMMMAMTAVVSSNSAELFLT